MGKRERLDKVLVERGLVASREEGRRRILAGEVLVRERPMTKAGELIDANAEIRLRGDSLPYVSRGGVKLEGALRHFGIDVRDKVALDIGASTGGFTDCLLAFGARRVYAVDVGYGQLHWRLRTDPRVVLLERTNVRYLKESDLGEAPDLATIDVSFISLRLVLPVVYGLLAPAGIALALVKPQFEVGKGKVGKGGVVRSQEDRLRSVEDVRAAALAIGFSARGLFESPLPGPKGNREFFLYLERPAAGRS
ncbi:MAG TPA: TlyA family RNA methyltransferase [Candidatus Acidoferrales bacterium]|nr:TlyA family RNA methyltransferase [Candidatus Acidoferrales bacterium]